jgi:hypothetical protein
MSEETKTDSAVDWIFSQLPDEYTTTPHGFDVYIIAKAMEREQMHSYIEEKWKQYRIETNEEDAWLFKQWLIEQIQGGDK